MGARKAGARLAGTSRRAVAELSRRTTTRSDGKAGARRGSLREAAAIDPRLDRLAAEAAEARAVADDAAAGLAAYRDRMDFDPARLEAMEDRLHLVRRLVRAHGGTEEAVGERLSGMRAELDLVDRHDDHRTRAEAAVRRAEQEATEAARSLTAARTRAARKLGREITAALEWLGMTGASIAVELRPLAEGLDAGGGKLGPLGAEAAELLFAPNPGEGRRPLERIASGGELSRLLLAVKRVLADRSRWRRISSTRSTGGLGGGGAARGGRDPRSGAAPPGAVRDAPACMAAQGEAHFEVEREENGRTVTAARAGAAGASMPSPGCSAAPSRGERGRRRPSWCAARPRGLMDVSAKREILGRVEIFSAASAAT